MTFSRRPGWMMALAVMSLLAGAAVARAGDWPAWRHDSRRSGATDEQLAETLHLAWTRELPPLKAAWPDQPKLDFDRCYQPVAAGGRMFVGSPRNDTLVAYSLETGDELWVFHAGGPIRFAPLAHEGKIYCASDDGYLYCLDAASGELAWKFRGGPSDRWILGNERLISTWPARGAPVIADGVLYFTAGIWPFMGIFIHALDAETGQLVWTNDGDGSMYIKQPHNSNSFAGVAPQGPLVVAGEMLFVPGGRSVPACYDRHTGKMVYYRLAENSKRAGGWQVAAADGVFFNGGYAFESATGDPLATLGGPAVFADDVLYVHRGSGGYAALDLAAATTETVDGTDRRGRKFTRKKWNLPELWTTDAPGGEPLIKAGSRLYGAAVNRIVAVDLPHGDEPATVSWQATVDAAPACLLAAEGRLLAVTQKGTIYCFGDDASEPRKHQLAKGELARDNEWGTKAREILDSSGVREGYCVAWGIGSGALVRELLVQSDLYVIVVDKDREQANRLRNELIEAGVYGTRASVHVDDPSTFQLPPYLASLSVSEDLIAAGVEPTADWLASMFESLRPYGGVAVLPAVESDRESLREAVAEAEIEKARFEVAGSWMLLRRVGSLPGSADWTHEHADAANTRVSRDSRVKAPLGILWFGGPSHQGVLPRHGHGPQPQTIDGRLIMEGADMLRATDMYTGRLLWERSLPGVGFIFDISGHQPGANGTGTNYISTPEGIYVAYENRCLKLDPASGETLAELELPPAGGSSEPPRWGYINVEGDYLIGGADPYLGDVDDRGRPKRGRTDNRSSSKRLVVMNRHNGEVLWSVEAENHFRHNAVCVGGGRLYCVDLLSEWELARLERRGEQPQTKSRLAAYDLNTGQLRWSTDQEVFGTWLSYSEKHDVLVESGRQARDVLSDEKRGMRAYAAADGAVIWKTDDRGPAIIHGDRVLVYRAACDLLTGEPVLREDPITGEEVPWRWARNYGCNTPMASEHLLTFRSGAAGFFDLLRDGGTGNFGGFRSGCTNNLVVAGGLLNAPDYTRTCVCSYQNQTSLALVHMPEAEIWTQFPLEGGKNLKHLGLNLGAPGSRRADDGLLWLHEYDGAQIEHEARGFYNSHSSKISGEGLPWVAASGCRGVRRVVVDPKLDPLPDAAVRYTVRLHFCDPDNSEPGVRVFNVRIQDEEKLKDFDIARAAGGRHRAVVRQFGGVEVRERLVVDFEPSESSSAGQIAEPLLCGLELIREP